jgi:hypothetical protein
LPIISYPFALAVLCIAPRRSIQRCVLNMNRAAVAAPPHHCEFPRANAAQSLRNDRASDKNHVCVKKKINTRKNMADGSVAVISALFKAR